MPHDGFIAFIFSGAFTAPTNQVVCLDKIECLRLDRTSACVTKFTAFWMTKWVGSNNEYKTKVIIDHSDVIEILNRLKQCNDFYRTSREKNRAFEVKHNMKMQDYLNIIHELSINDYAANTKSVDNKYLGNDLIVFIPKRHFTLLNGMKLKNILIYIKIDLTETDDVIAAISFHDTDGNEFEPCKK